MDSKYQIQKDLEDGQESLNLIREDLFSVSRPSNLTLENILDVIKLLDRKFERIYDELGLSEYYDIHEQMDSDIGSNALRAQKEEDDKNE